MVSASAHKPDTIQQQHTGSATQNLERFQHALPNSSMFTAAASELFNYSIPPPKTSSGYSLFEVVLIIVAGSSLSILTTVGNLMVLVSFKIDRQLQTISNYFLFSLAVADLAIGLISCPLMTLYTVKGEWTLGYIACQFWLSVDYLMSNASVMNLLLISFDRFFSVTRPLTYRPRRTAAKTITLIAFSYILSLLLWPPWIIAWPYIEGQFVVAENQCVVQFLLTNAYVAIGTAVAAFYLPVLIMIVLYARVFHETRKRHRDFKYLQGFNHHRPVSLGASKQQQNHHEPTRFANVSFRSMVVGYQRPEICYEEPDSETADLCSTSSKRKNAAAGQQKRQSTCSLQLSSATGRRRSSLFDQCWRQKQRNRSRNASSAIDEDSWCDSRCSSSGKDSVKSNKKRERGDAADNGLKPKPFVHKKVNCQQSAECNPEPFKRANLSPNDPSVATTDQTQQQLYTVLVEMVSDTDTRLTQLTSSSSNRDCDNSEAALDSLRTDAAYNSWSKNVSSCNGMSRLRSDAHACYSTMPKHNVPVIRLKSNSLASTTCIVGGGGQFSPVDSLRRLSSCSLMSEPAADGNDETNGRRFSRALRLTKQAQKRAQQQVKKQNERRQESKAAKTLSAILLAFIITWAPYNILVCMNALNYTVPETLWVASYFMCYLNSTVNPICYALCNANFRRTYLRILTWKWKRKNKARQRGYLVPVH